MSHATNDELLAVVRELSRETTPQELESRGVRRVRSIGIDTVSLLIERAVNRTLMKRTIGGLGDGELDALRSEAEAEFAQQLSELQVLTDSRQLVEKQHAKVRADLDALRDSIAAPAQVDPEVAAARAAERRREMRLRIQALLLPMHDAAPEHRPGVRKVAEEILALFEEYERMALDEQRRELEERVEIERRRVAKLVATLETTEIVLAELARMKDVEQGIASIYRTVQGLSCDEADYQTKLALLRQIFSSNVTLRDTVFER